MEAACLVDKAPSAHGGPVPADGGAPDTPRPKVGVTQAALDSFDRDKPRPFRLEELTNHILYLQAARPNKSNVLESVTATVFAEGFKSILDKIGVLRRDPRIQFMMKDWDPAGPTLARVLRSEEHTSALQSLMRTSYADICSQTQK